MWCALHINPPVRDGCGGRGGGISVEHRNFEGKNANRVGAPQPIKLSLK
jgi:hypothetical protein